MTELEILWRCDVAYWRGKHYRSEVVEIKFANQNTKITVKSQSKYSLENSIYFFSQLINLRPENLQEAPNQDK